LTLAEAAAEADALAEQGEERKLAELRSQFDEELERDQRRAPARRAHVLESAAEELGLLPEAELADRAVGDGANPEVLRSRIVLEVVVPLRPQLRERALGACVRERIGFGGCLGERHSECAGAPT